MSRSVVVGLAATLLAASTTLSSASASVAAAAAGMAPTSSVARPPGAVTGAVALLPQADPPAPVAAKLPVRAEPDGSPVELDVSFYGQADGTRHPLVLLAHGFGGSKDSVAAQAVELQQRGYVVARGALAGTGSRAAGSTSTPPTTR